MKKYDYPVILVPGLCAYGESGLGKNLPYFGQTAKLLRAQGLTCHTATFTALNGVWDRACELYAQIIGGTVDYGAAHAEKYGTNRFGVSYPGFVSNWNNTNKVSLVAYGFGAPVARLLAYLLENGSKKEQESGAADISPLFKGGMGESINVIITLAGDNDGTTFFQALDEYVPFTETATKLIWKAKSLFRGEDKLTYGELTDARLEKYLNAGRDNLFFDVGLEGMAQLNKLLKINPNVYYVSFTGETSKNVKEFLPELKTKKHGNPFTDKKINLLDVNLDIPTLASGILAPFALLIGTYKNYLPEKPVATPVYHANDGFMPTNCALAPSTEEYTSFRYLDECRPGVWYQMPIEAMNHLAFLGYFVKKDKFQNFVLDLADILTDIG